jgi:fructose-1,6-bisphosphatase/inositol monophosphatase family enzyme
MDELQQARRLLCALQIYVRDALLAARTRSSLAERFSEIAAVTKADTIYQIDKVSEDAIIRWFEEHWPRSWPVELVMEGIDEAGLTFPRGTPVEKTKWKCILDPIDGTRGIMYDKRSAWSLAGLAPQRGEKTTVADIVVAAMTELPTSKQWRSDQVSAIRGVGAAGVRATWTDVHASPRVGKRASGKLILRPSTATDCRHGFASLARFFPDGKTLLSQFEEELWARVENQKRVSQKSANPSPVIFDDQYISTGGQLYEILVGHDRFIGDLRPLAFAKLNLPTSLVCHPYDICTELILNEAGAIVEDPLGKKIRAPLDTTSPVSWLGFANAALARKLRPELKRLIKKYFD